MGFKASMILIQPDPGVSEPELLQKLGFGDLLYTENTTFDNGIYPRDESVSIGRYNGCLIICEDYQLTTELAMTKTPGVLAVYEKTLTELFPGVEVLTIACHSATNYHLYALAKDKQRIRYKRISGDSPLVEWGEWLEEEVGIYATSDIIGGKRLFKSSWGDSGYIYKEDQMMENFAFGVAKRHLGVMISGGDAEELRFQSPFRKYKPVENKVKSSKPMQTIVSIQTEEYLGGQLVSRSKKRWWMIWKK